VRTIVFSDVDGEPDVIRGVLEHSHYSMSNDRLIFAGDAIDIGRDSAGCVSLLDELGAEFLVGNHEYGAFVDWGFEPLDQDVAETVRRRIQSGDWRLAAVADGVLITHAGLSAQWEDQFRDAGGCDIERFTEALNDEFRGAVELGLWATEGVLDDDGPLWWRPGRGEVELPGVPQVLGHTPPELLGSRESVDRLAESGFYLVDPCVRSWAGRGFSAPVPLRYAVIQEGTVRIVDPALGD